MGNIRLCHNVIAEMLKLIPEEGNEDFIKDLNWNLNDSIYKAPEETLQWQRTMETLQKHIPEPEKDWEWEIISMFTTKPIEELKNISVMKKAKLGDHLLWEGKLAKIISTSDRPTVTIEMYENCICDKCGNDMGKHQFSIIPDSPLFQQNAEPLQTIDT